MRLSDSALPALLATNVFGNGESERRTDDLETSGMTPVSIGHSGRFQSDDGDPSCTEIVYAPPGTRCGQIAEDLQGIHLTPQEFRSFGDSQECRDALRCYGVCVVLETVSTTSSQSSTLIPSTTYALSTSMTVQGSSKGAVSTSKSETSTSSSSLGSSSARQTNISTTSSSSSYPSVSTLSSVSQPPQTYTSSTISPSAPSSSAISSALKTSTTSTSCSASIASPPAATNSGTVPGCTQWYVPTEGEFCYTVAQKFGISTETFMLWNPSVLPPGCTEMLAGDAYCVAVCGGSSTVPSSYVASITTLITSTISSTAASTSETTLPSASSSPLNVYKSYNGDGSVADGWPAQSQWVNYTYMFELNMPLIAVSCEYSGVPNNSPEETTELMESILAVGDEFSMDPRFVLAIVMQESRGCVRVETTSYSHANPGLMQSYEGSGTCNNNTGDLEDPGVSQVYAVLNPCPLSEIHQMIVDGVNGTTAGPGLVQNWATQNATAPDFVSNYYRTARIYNGGTLDPTDLAEPCCTASYASDVANRLTGWTDGEDTFQAT